MSPQRPRQAGASLNGLKTRYDLTRPGCAGCESILAAWSPCKRNRVVYTPPFSRRGKVPLAWLNGRAPVL